MTTVKHAASNNRAHKLSRFLFAATALFSATSASWARKTLFSPPPDLANGHRPVRPGTPVFRDCYVEGNVDFIFGDSLAVFDHCLFMSSRTKRS